MNGHPDSNEDPDPDDNSRPSGAAVAVSALMWVCILCVISFGLYAGIRMLFFGG